MRPRLLAETTVEPQAQLRRAPHGRWTVTTNKELLVLSAELDLVHSFDLPYPTSGAHAVSPELDRAVLSLADRILTLDHRGRILWERPHLPWAEGHSGSCWIQDDGAVWATMPGPKECDRWVVLSSGDGHLMADLRLDGHGSGSDVVAHPGGRATGLSVGTGTGAFQLYWGHTDRSGAQLRRAPGQNHILTDIHPDGLRYLTLTVDHETLAVHDITDDRVLARATSDTLFDGDVIDFGAAYLTPDTVVARSVFGGEHLLLDADRLTPRETIRYPVAGEHDTVFSAGPGRWVTADWLDGRIRHWEL
jgi:hypothetical protein